MKMKRTFVLCFTLLVCASLALGGTIAYLSDTDSDVNVMTLGNVKIDLIEKERAADGSMTDFTDNHPLHPGVYEALATDTEGYWANVSGAVDKVVTVKNVGKSPAYVRVWFAFETTNDAAFFDQMIHLNKNETESEWKWEFLKEADGSYTYLALDNARYVAAVATYQQPLAVDAVTPVSLRQVLLDSAADNDDIAALGDKYSIFVVAQGIQTAGFGSAEAALTEGFGAAMAAKHPFANMTEAGVSTPTPVPTATPTVTPTPTPTATPTATPTPTPTATPTATPTVKPTEAPAASVFTYTSNSDGTITITGYTGTDANVVIPATIDGKTVTAIGQTAFRGRLLESVTIPETVTSIGNSAFQGCASLESVTIPETVTSIGNYAFQGCASLGSVTIPEAVTIIGNSAFRGCASLEIVNYYGTTEPSFGSYVFSNTSVVTINVSTSYTSDTFCGFPVSKVL